MKFLNLLKRPDSLLSARAAQTSDIAYREPDKHAVKSAKGKVKTDTAAGKEIARVNGRPKKVIRNITKRV